MHMVITDVCMYTCGSYLAFIAVVEYVHRDWSQVLSVFSIFHAMLLQNISFNFNSISGA